MPKVSKQSAKHDDYGPVESWHEEVEGHTIEFVTFKQDIDSTPMLKGLPNDQCHCPHWGYVLKGRVTFTVDGREDVFEQRKVTVPEGRSRIQEKDCAPSVRTPATSSRIDARSSRTHLDQLPRSTRNAQNHAAASRIGPGPPPQVP